MCGVGYMRVNIFLALLMCMPVAATAAVRDDAAVRVGVSRANQAGARMPTVAVTSGLSAQTNNTTTAAVTSVSSGASAAPVAPAAPTNTTTVTDTTATASDSCRDAYRACMDQFCLLDESEGYRCACSSNIEQSKSLIQEIQEIQEEADLLYTEGVEREQLGAQAKLVFGESDAAQKSSRVSGISFTEWINSGVDDDASLGADYDIGDNLYAMAAEFCADRLAACGDDAEMEEMLYARQIVQDCKTYEAYLNDQKSIAEQNKRTAEAAVRQARLQMLDTTNKYNQGECLLAYRACIADKGGCGVNFENCLDADLLQRRANACENVLEQCMAVREIVLADWEAEAESILVEAAKYADQNARATCLARIQLCLEDSCSPTTNSACLNDIEIAADICPVIEECEELAPGIKDSVARDLGTLRVQFCQNDVDACLRDRCGENFTSPECLGKSASEIAALCPQSMFPSCAEETQFNIILQAVLLELDNKLLTGCLNYFGERLGSVCGTDMSCLPTDDNIVSLTLDNAPETEAEHIALRDAVRNSVRETVDEFFVQFEQDMTVDACKDSQKPTDKKNLGDMVFTAAKQTAYINATSRAMQELDDKLAELARLDDAHTAEEKCYNNYQVETPDESDSTYSYISSVMYEPSLGNCHVCRVQRVCEVGGQSAMTGAMQGVAGGLSAGASMGTMVSPGWGTLIGGVVGGLGGGLLGGFGSGEEEFCQEIETCEDINVSALR